MAGGGLALLLADVARIDVRLHPPHDGLSLDARFPGGAFDAVRVAAVEGVDEGLHGKRGLGHHSTKRSALDTT